MELTLSQTAAADHVQMFESTEKIGGRLLRLSSVWDDFLALIGGSLTRGVQYSGIAPIVDREVRLI